MSLAFLALGILASFILFAELGYRVGTRSTYRENEHARSQVTTVQASVLGLLALLLGFTMSMAESRFSARREVMFMEAGAIQKTYLWADTLPEPFRAQSRELLRRYVVERHTFYEASAVDAPSSTARAELIQGELMVIASRLAHEHPDWDLTAGYLDTLTEMIRLEAARELSLAARVPRTIHMLLLLVAVIAIGVSGLASGLVRARSVVTLYVVPVLLAFACLVVADLDISRAGFIKTGDRPMTRLEHTILLDARR